ncbi:hypothetical protein ACJ72_01622 [Emergomyces africanus]|uniref:Uncharacterized protein n=1 Tax=Emergomyces africanus TaxID=1955775 RepID=A0A1B7P4P8_9EURO|nr:hypothetical protein ACJ72_01622 [Emergomyces africanus]
MKVVGGILAFGAACQLSRAGGVPGVPDQVAGAGLDLSAKEVLAAEPRQDMGISARSFEVFGEDSDPLKKSNGDKAKKSDESSNKKSDGNPDSPVELERRKKFGGLFGGKKIGGGGGGGGGAAGSAAATGPKVRLLETSVAAGVVGSLV